MPVSLIFHIYISKDFQKAVSILFIIFDSFFFLNCLFSQPTLSKYLNEQVFMKSILHA